MEFNLRVKLAAVKLVKERGLTVARAVLERSSPLLVYALHPAERGSAYTSENVSG